MNRVEDVERIVTAPQGVVAIRGAVQAAANDPSAIRRAVHQLLGEITLRNPLREEDIVACLFTVTPDITSSFPARYAREWGWRSVPLLDLASPAVPGDLPRVIRVLVLTAKLENSCHVYLGATRQLRPDLFPENNVPSEGGLAHG
ncbi:MAG: chorismate mutase [Bacillota bacterium]|nr:chorismate mutase [Bacillota bacterium]